MLRLAHYRLQLLQALMTLAAFNSSSLRLRFNFLYHVSLMTSLFSFLALPFGHRFLAFAFGSVFVSHIILPMARVRCRTWSELPYTMLIDAFFAMPYHHTFILIIVHDFQYLPAS
jgi:hypothetical protein